MGDATASLIVLQNSASAWIGVIGALSALAGVGLTAFVTYRTQLAQLNSAREAEEERWHRENRLRNIDERRQACLDYLGKVRPLEDLDSELDDALKRVNELLKHWFPHDGVPPTIQTPESSQEQSAAISQAIDEVDRLQKDLESSVADIEALRTKVEVFAHEEPTWRSARVLFENFEALRQARNKQVAMRAEILPANRDDTASNRLAFRKYLERYKEQQDYIENVRLQIERGQDTFAAAARHELSPARRTGRDLSLS